MCDVVLYGDAERVVVTQRFRTPLTQIKENWQKFAQEVRRQNIFPAGWGITEYFCQGEFNPDDVDYELMLPVALDINVQAPLGTRKLEAVTVASIIHRGLLDKIGGTYDKLFNWIDKQGLQVVGNVREVYLRCPHTTLDPAGFVTEIQVPVR